MLIKQRAFKFRDGVYISHYRGPYFHRGTGRYHIVEVYFDGSTRTMNYAKFLIEQKIKRPLKKNETADHIDNIKTNDKIANLQILSNRLNIQKKLIDRPELKMKFKICICPNCKISFKKRVALIHNYKGYKGPFCSHSCAIKFRYNN